MYGVRPEDVETGADDEKERVHRPKARKEGPRTVDNPLPRRVQQTATVDRSRSLAS
jgi:hypothetical protein